MVPSDETEQSVLGTAITGFNEDFDRSNETMRATHGLPPVCVGRPACQKFGTTMGLTVDG
jgi:hypothetical protein